MQNFTLRFIDRSQLPTTEPKWGAFYCTCCNKWKPSKYLQYTTKREKVCNWCGATYMPAEIAAVIESYK